MSLRIIACLLCDATRPEIAGKTTVLGFYGVLPNATVQVAQLELPLPGLCFLVQSEQIGADGAATVRLRVQAPDGTELVRLKYDNVALREGRSVLAGFNITPFSFVGPGKYMVFVDVDEVESFRTSFGVERMPPETVNALRF